MSKEKENQKEVKKVLVERETYQRNGEEYYAYFVKGVVRNKEVKANLKPTDIGGYEVLDIVFGDDNTAELITVVGVMKDESTGKEITYTSYEAQNVDEVTGEIYKIKIKPSKPSDKSLLEMILPR